MYYLVYVISVIVCSIYVVMYIQCTKVNWPGEGHCIHACGTCLRIRARVFPGTYNVAHSLYVTGKTVGSCSSYLFFGLYSPSDFNKTYRHLCEHVVESATPKFTLYSKIQYACTIHHIIFITTQ